MAIFHWVTERGTRTNYSTFPLLQKPLLLGLMPPSATFHALIQFFLHAERHTTEGNVISERDSQCEEPSAAFWLKGKGVPNYACKGLHMNNKSAI